MGDIVVTIFGNCNLPQPLQDSPSFILVSPSSFPSVGGWGDGCKRGLLFYFLILEHFGDSNSPLFLPRHWLVETKIEMLLLGNLDGSVG